MSLLASSAQQVLVNACTYKCENRKTSSWLQTKNGRQLQVPNKHFMWEFCFSFIFHCLRKSWHAMYKKTVLSCPIQWQSSDMQCTRDEVQLSYLTKKSSLTQSRCWRMDRKHRSFSLSAEFICFSISKQWSASLY